MASALTFLALVFAAVQLATAKPRITLEYSDCMNNVAATKKMFDQAMASYWQQISPKQMQVANTFGNNLRKMEQKGGDCIEKSMAGKSEIEYVYLGSQPCKVFPLKKDYVAPWSNKQEVSDKDACLFISTKGKVALKMAYNNLIMMKSCNGIQWFIDTYVRMYNQCKAA